MQPMKPAIRTSFSMPDLATTLPQASGASGNSMSMQTPNDSQSSLLPTAPLQHPMGKRGTRHWQETRSATYLPGPTVLDEVKTSSRTLASQAGLTTLSNHVRKIKPEDSRSKHPIRSKLYKGEPANYTSDKVKEMILFAKYRAKNDSLPEESRLTEEELFAKAAGEAFVPAENTNSPTRFQVLRRHYRKEYGFRSFPAAAMAGVVSFPALLAMKVNNQIPRVVKDHIQLHKDKAKLQQDQKQYGASKDNRARHTGSDDNFGFASPLDHPELYEGATDAELQKMKSPAVSNLDPEALLQEIDLFVQERGEEEALAWMTANHVDAFVDFMKGKIQA